MHRTAAFRFFLLLVCSTLGSVAQSNYSQTNAYSQQDSVKATDFRGNTGDQQINAAIQFACSTGAPSVTLSGIGNLSIAAQVSLGCPNGQPLAIYLGATGPFTPGTQTVDMFLLLPGARVYGIIDVDIRHTMKYSGSVLQLAGHTYDNQPGNSSDSRGTTSMEGLTVAGGGNTSATALDLQSDNSTDYIQFVDFGKVVVQGTKYGIRMRAWNNGWINSNTFTSSRCTNTVYCLVFDTTDSTGSTNGNTFTTFEDEYGDNYKPASIYAIWFKGFGLEENNSFPTVRMWDWPRTATTIKVDKALGYTYGNTLNGMVNSPLVDDPSGTLDVVDTLTATSQGVVRNTNGAAIYPYFQATNPGKGFLLGDTYALTGDGASTVIRAMAANGTVQLQNASGDQRLVFYPDGFVSAPAGYEIGGSPVLAGSGGNAYLMPQDRGLGSVAIGTANWKHALWFDPNGTLTAIANGLGTANLFSIYHDSSSVTGTLWYVDVAHGGGSFTGNLFQFWNGLKLKFGVDSEGNTTLHDLHVTGQCDGCGQQVQTIAAKDTPGALTISAGSCIDRSVSISGLSQSAVLSVAALYNLEPNVIPQLGELDAGNVHYRLCNLSSADVMLNSGSIFAISGIQSR